MANTAGDRFETSPQGESADPQLTPLVDAARVAALLSGPPPPPPHHLLPGRQRFLAEAARLREAAVPRRRLFGPLGHRARLAGALVSAVVVLGLVFGAGSAIAGSLPGDPLYQLKLAIDEARLRWGHDPENRVDAALDVAGERLGEMSRVLAAGETVDESTAARLRYQLQSALRAVDEAQSQADLATLARHMETVRRWQQNMTQAVDELPAPEQALVQELARETKLLREELRAGRGEAAHTPQPAPAQATATGQAGPGPQPSQGPGPQATDTSTPMPTATATPSEQPGQQPGGGTPQGGPPPTDEEGPNQPDPTGQPGEGGPPATGEPGPGEQPGPGEPQPTEDPGSGPGEPPATQGPGEGKGKP